MRVDRNDRFGPKVVYWQLVRDVRFGSKADIGARPINVRFTPESGHWDSAVECPFCAKSRHSAMWLKTSLFDHLVGAEATVARAEPLRAWLSGVVKSGV